MTTTIVLSEDAANCLNDAINIVYEKYGIMLRQKDIVPLLFRDPKEIAEIVTKNIKRNLV